VAKATPCGQEEKYQKVGKCVTSKVRVTYVKYNDLKLSLKLEQTSIKIIF